MDAKLYDVMNAQVTEEYLAAYLYRHLANEMTELGFDGAATWFIAQAQEEVEHAAKFTKHLQDRGCSSGWKGRSFSVLSNTACRCSHQSDPERTRRCFQTTD